MNIRPTRNFPAPQRPKGREFAVAAASSWGSEPLAENYRRRAADVEQVHHNQNGYDEGLVHSHDWAVSDR